MGGNVDHGGNKIEQTNNEDVYQTQVGKDLKLSPEATSALLKRDVKTVRQLETLLIEKSYDALGKPDNEIRKEIREAFIEYVNNNNGE